ncbi:unnamed protein product [Schistocephalus solidus]|uniref:Uncharacterized protein n=1 Tax=Schistocephalus solidus TaxID=70667 RepID=A0A183TLH7_SCHSO|nr:unnamed protein product [Schistocephalus solidus]
MDCNRRHQRWSQHMPTFEKVPVSSIGDADRRLHITVGVHQQSRENETEQVGGQYAALLPSVGHCECFGYRPIVSDWRRHRIVKLTYRVREPLRTADFLHNCPQSVVIHRFKDSRQIHEGIVVTQCSKKPTTCTTVSTNAPTITSAQNPLASMTTMTPIITGDHTPEVPPPSTIFASIIPATILAVTTETTTTIPFPKPTIDIIPPGPS